MASLKDRLTSTWASFAQWLRTTSAGLRRVWSKRKKIGQEMKHRQRFVVMDTVTYKEKWSFQLSAINLFVTIGITTIVLMVLTAVLIAFTPLRELIPGYANQHLTEQTYQNSHVLDSLEVELARQERMMTDLKDVLMGRDPAEREREADSLRRSQQAATGEGKDYTHSAADSALRKEVEEQDRYSVGSRSGGKDHEATPVDNTPTILLFTPLKGKVISSFDEKTRHYGVDIAGAENQTIKSVAPGTVVFSNFTIETGYVIAIQHQGGMMSVYKHNSALLKHEGDVVRAGEPICYLGNTGELTTGPHLHFELWVAGKPVNPLVYISF